MWDLFSILWEVASQTLQRKHCPLVYIKLNFSLWQNFHSIPLWGVKSFLWIDPSRRLKRFWHWHSIIEVFCSLALSTLFVNFFFFLFSFFHSLSLFGHCIWQRNKSQILICLSLTFNLFVCYLFFEALFVLLCCQCHAHYLALTWSSICCVFWPAFMHTKMLS